YPTVVPSRKPRRHSSQRSVAMTTPPRSRSLHVEQVGDITVVRVAATELLDDGTIELIGEQLYALADHLGARKVVLNLSPVRRGAAQPDARQDHAPAQEAQAGRRQAHPVGRRSGNPPHFRHAQAAAVLDPLPGGTGGPAGVLTGRVPTAASPFSLRAIPRYFHRAGSRAGRSPWNRIYTLSGSRKGFP